MSHGCELFVCVIVLLSVECHRVGWRACVSKRLILAALLLVSRRFARLRDDPWLLYWCVPDLIGIAPGKQPDIHSRLRYQCFRLRATLGSCRPIRLHGFYGRRTCHTPRASVLTPCSIARCGLPCSSSIRPLQSLSYNPHNRLPVSVCQLLTTLAPVFDVMRIVR